MPIPEELNPESVRNWAQDLPLANKALAGRESYAILAALPEQPLGYKRRLAVLDVVTPIVELVLDHLQAQIIGEHPKADAFLALALDTLQLLEANYQQLGRDARDRSHSYLREKAASLAMTREAQCLLEQLLFRYLDHQDAPPLTWARLTALGTAAKEKDRAPFYQAIALHLGILYRLPPPAIRDVYRHLKLLPIIKLVKLGTPACSAGQTGFFVGPGDEPPAYGTLSADAFPVDLSALRDSLTGERKEAPLNPAVVADLKVQWSEGTRTKERRLVPQKRLVTTARFGYSDIVDFLAELVGGPTDDEGLVYQTVTGDLKQVINKQPAKTVDVQIDDISDHGCRITTDFGDFRSGEVVCINWHRKEKRIGTVVWFRKASDRRVCGVQWLLNQAQAVRVRFNSDQVAALTGQSPKTGRDAILYGNRHHPQDEVCLVETAEGWQQHELTVTVKKDLVEVAETLPAAPAGAPLEQPVPTQPVRPKVEPAAQYQDVWDVLSPSSRPGQR